MKRAVYFLLTCMLLLGGCGQKLNAVVMDTGAIDKYLIDKSAHMAGLISSLSGVEGYAEIYSISEDIIYEIEGINTALQQEPQSAVVLELSEETLLLMLLASTDGLQLDETQSDYLSGRMITVLPNMLNAQGGSQLLAAASILGVTESYMAYKDMKATLVFLFYNESWCICISFLPSKEGTALVNAMPVKLQDGWREYFDEGRMDRILSNLPMLQGTCRTIPGDKLQKLWPGGE